jgi:hypothetical protein
MADKLPPHPPHQAKHPGRGKVQPHQRSTFQQEAHAHAMKRRAEPLSIAMHSLMPGPDPKDVK